MLKFKYNEAPPLGYSYVYLEFFFTDNGKPFMCYPGITSTSIDGRKGNRLANSFYKTMGKYATPVQRLTRLVGSDHIKTVIVGCIKTEYAQHVEHMLILLYKNLEVNVSNTKNEIIDTSALAIPSTLLMVDPIMYKPIDVFKNVEEAAEQTGLTIYDLNSAIEEQTELNRYLWMYSHDYDPPENEEDLYLGNKHFKEYDYTVKGMFDFWMSNPSA